VTKCGALFDAAGSAAFPGSLEKSMFLAGFLNSKIAGAALGAINPTVNFQAWNIGNLPLDISLLNSKSFSETIWSLHDIAEADWNDFETSWDFQSLPIVKNGLGKNETLESSYKIWSTKSEKDTAEMQRLEEINNRIFIDAYGLADELTNDVPLFQITLKANPVNRYGDTHKDDELWIRFRQESCEELISYAIGCMMGRYSLDEPGLIYAHAGNVGFEPGSYATFPADGDGIVPITDELWFSDDACSRIREFLRAVWGPDTLEENMAWLSESLGAKPAETPDETIRRYIADKFFKDHLQTYKKRPIYWLFSSGKQGAFQALVYLHRYSEGTLARLRAEYVVPLTGKIQSRIEMLQKDANAASSTAARNKLAKEVEKLKKKHVELLAYDEQLRHYADMRINLDLDDGVKVNYGKFGDLLAEVKAVTGGAGDE
jgi:type II restriction/modification system DNA methylase subunit YeeA